MRFRIGIQPKMLDPNPDPDKMNADPQPWDPHLYLSSPVLGPLIRPLRTTALCARPRRCRYSASHTDLQQVKVRLRHGRISDENVFK
jgi:hypothetical protein